MEHINDLHRDLREFGARIDAAHAAVTDFLAKQKKEIDLPRQVTSETRLVQSQLLRPASTA